MKKETVPVRNSLLLLLTATIWGIAFVAQSVSMDYIGGFTFNSIRSLIGSLTLLPVILLLSKPKSAEEKNRPQTSSNQKILITGGICCGIILCLASNFQQFGIKYTTVGKAGFITACYIIIVPVIGIFLRKKCSPFIWIAVILSLCGLYLLCLTPGEGFAFGKGELLVLVCAFLFSIHIQMKHQICLLTVHEYIFSFSFPAFKIAFHNFTNFANKKSCHTFQTLYLKNAILS